MITWATVEIEDEGVVIDIDVDTNDDGYAYIKQSNEWVVVPIHRVGELIEALQKLPPPR